MLEHLQWAAFGLAMIRPRFAANGNVLPPIEPDDPPPPKSALEVPDAPRKDICGTLAPDRPTSWSAPDPMYSGKYIEPHQFAHRFALWMVETSDNDWQMAWQVDRQMAKFCQVKNYRHPNCIMIRSILGDMMGGNYIARAYAHSARFRHLDTWIGKKKQIAVYRFTTGLARHLTKPANLHNQISAIETTLERLNTNSRDSHVATREPSVRRVSRNKKSGKRTKTHKQNPIKTAHYLDDESWGVAA